MSRIWLVLCLLGVLVACSAPARQGDALPTATLSAPPATATSSEPELGPSAYQCAGHENGLLASAGGFTFNADGTFSFRPSSTAGGNTEHGRYSYDDATNTYTFIGHPVFDHAVFDEDLKYLLVSFKPGKILAHADTGRLECQ